MRMILGGVRSAREVGWRLNRQNKPISRREHWI